MKKKIFIALLFVGLVSFAQTENNPVVFKTSFEKISDTEYNLIFKAKIQPNWHFYSQYNPEGASLPLEFTAIDKTPNFKLLGKAIESKTHKEYSEIWKKEEIFFSNSATIIQKIKLKDKAVTSIKINLYGQACKTSCIQIDKDFIFDLTKISLASKKLLPNKTKKEATVNVIEKGRTSKNQSLWALFILSFFAGFAALLTPCVFPMIPMTVSFFTKQSKNRAVGIRNAIIFGVSIIVLYVLLGVVVSKIFGADALNALSTNVWFNVVFFILLVVFAISFLGAFEIILPSSWGTKVDAKADKGGIIGIFFMALALAIVSFSCTGPIVGTALVAAASQGGIAPIISMLGFSLAIALPFTLFAAFPGWMNSLPKSGGWLNTVKVVLGFLELALAFKFLSNADLVLDLHLLEREVFIAIWIAIFGALAFYLFGKIQLPHDSPLPFISVGRLSLGLVVLSFTIYMIPGLWGAPLNLISAFPPPQHYSESPYGVGFSKLGSRGTTNHADIPEGAHLMAPYDIVAFNDYDKGLAYAKKVNKPIFIDFTGKACVNCRKMEQNVWVKDKVLEKLKNDVVLISLYVDDKRPLPLGQEVDSKLKPGKKLRYIGQKWSELQTIRYKTNSQPFYVLMNHQEEDLNTPLGYTPDVDTYYNWLIDGIQKFTK